MDAKDTKDTKAEAIFVDARSGVGTNRKTDTQSHKPRKIKPAVWQPWSIQPPKGPLRAPNGPPRPWSSYSEGIP